MTKKTDLDQPSSTKPKSTQYPTRKECICLLLDKENLARIIRASQQIQAEAQQILELLPDKDDPDQVFLVRNR